jgi:hypothetical protein
MEYKIERLTAKDYDELLGMLNTVFNKPEGNTFDIFLPVMWERDDEHMSKHIAIKEDGKISAVVGIYPLPANVCGEKIVFSTNSRYAPSFYDDSGEGLCEASFTIPENHTYVRVTLYGKNGKVTHTSAYFIDEIIDK